MADSDGASPCKKPKLDLTEPESDFIRTSFAFTWVIKDYKNWPIKKDLRSTEFEVGENSGNKGVIVVNDTKWYNVRLEVEPRNSTEIINAVVKLSIVNDDFCKRNEIHHFCTFSSSSKKRGFRIPRDDLLKEEKSFLAHGNLVLCCEITVIDYPIVRKSNCSSNQNYSIGKCLSTLLTASNVSDFVVEVKGKQFKCHKCVLASRSEVFCAMLKHNMKEKNQNQLILTDIEPNVFEKLLCFIYTGRVDVTSSEAIKLYLAADKYGLESLKILCEKHLCASIFAEDALKLFTFASDYGLRKLAGKSLCILGTFTKYIEVNSPTAEINPTQENSQSESSSSLTHTTNLSSAPQEVEVISAKLVYLQNITPSVTVDNVIPGVSGDFPSCILGSCCPTIGNEMWCRTESRICATTKWSVDVSNVGLESRDINEHLFFDSYNQATWQIKISVICKSHDRHLFLYMTLLSSRKNRISAEYIVSAENINNKELILGSQLCKKNVAYAMGTFSSMGINCTNSIVVFSCSLMTRKSFLHDCRLPTIPEHELEKNISTLLNDECFADITVKIGKEQFRCHKALLECRSPYFYSIFQQNPTVSALEIEDIEPNMFEKIIHNIYTSECELTNVEAEVFLPLANKYGLSLKSVCEDILITALTVENAVETLLSAVSQNALKLQERTLRFIGDHLPDIMESPHWSDIMKCRSLLLKHLNILDNC